MIAGAATTDGTASYALRHKDLQFDLLGRTGWRVSQAGFGCYRVSAGIEPHFQAMVHAFSNGINLIDTSTNYSDGDSETLVGNVLQHLTAEGIVERQETVVVSKVGYLQGRNLALSREREQGGNPYPELVPYGEGLQHCIHPEFIEDQLSLSLERLQLETLDVLLLHNPEYYLGWVSKQGVDADKARREFYRRIGRAFEHLEKEVARGRIQAYGISANTFPAAGQDAEFVSLERVSSIAAGISKNPQFHVIQLPMNIFETGAVLEKNQESRRNVLTYAHDQQLGVLINRPLNAFNGQRLIRLAEVERIGRHSDGDVVQAITLMNKSEKALWRKHLPALNLPAPLYGRIKDQISVGNQLKHHWRSFGNYHRWRQFKDGLLWPYVQGVFDFLEGHAEHNEDLGRWLASHRKKLDAAVRAVGSLYVDGAVREADAIKRELRAADTAWDVDGSLSQLALRAVRSTTGVNCVLVGMRREPYVDDVLQELKRPVEKAYRRKAWEVL